MESDLFQSHNNQIGQNSIIIINRSKYREERTLVRGLRRYFDDGRSAFKSNVDKLHKHFIQFNIDVSEICQWLMGLRPDGKKYKRETKPFWDFFLEPEKYLSFDDESKIDLFRVQFFDIVAGLDVTTRRPENNFSKELLDSINFVSVQPRTSQTEKMFVRLQQLSLVHRMILLKVAKEWICARYLRVNDNWLRQFDEWNKEKIEWEKKHPELTENIRNQYNDIFKELDIKENRPRVCTCDKLKLGKDNCNYAGEKCGGKILHSSLCKKFYDFNKEANKSNIKKYFKENAELYLSHRGKNYKPKQAIDALLKSKPKASWFEGVWKEYLKALEINEDTILRDYNGKLPHCQVFSDDKECEFNKHTDICTKYYNLLKGKEPAFQEIETLYREWRSLYFKKPRKPVFRYPSSHILSVPKIFGKDFFEIDLKNSVLRLRLDNMPNGQFLNFCFKPWPEEYDIQLDSSDITSVHIHFIGTRARAGFRFKVNHKPSRFRISQDKIDELRSRKFPRQSQDEKFLEAVREQLCTNFEGIIEKELKFITVDLGITSGSVAFFEGMEIKEKIPLKIIKMEKLFDELPNKNKKKYKGKKNSGLSKEHVGRHLEDFSEESKKIADKRKGNAKGAITDFDLRGLTLHIHGMLRDWVRLNASQIIKIAEEKKVDLIIFESMRGFKAPGYDSLDINKKRRMAFFAYGKIRRKVAEKAVERGMRVITVPYLKSSQFCSECCSEQTDKNRWNNNKKTKKFVCEYQDCPYQDNSDNNAAVVLGKVFWGQIELPVNV